jgi:membrane protease YdiL (CAAX protease family)
MNSDSNDGRLLPTGRAGLFLDAVIFVLAVLVSIVPSFISVPSIAVYPFIALIILYWVVRLVNPTSVVNLFERLDIKRLSAKEYGFVLVLSLLSVGIELVLQFVSTLFLNSQTASHSIARSLDFTDPLVFLGLPVLFFLVVAPLEEIIFRYGIQRKLLSRYFSSTSIRVVLTSVVFALLHFADYSADAGTALTLATICISSLLLGFVYEYTDNLSYPILIHGITNTIAVILLTLSAFNIF